MTPSRDQLVQAALAAGRVPEGEGSGELAAYRLVFQALEEDPGFELPADFADAVTARVFPTPERAGWWERVMLPILLAAGLAGSAAVGAEQFAFAIGLVLRSVAPLLDRVAEFRLDVLAAALTAALFVAAADRVLGRSLRQQL